jgi:hypothetical protein
MADAPTVGRSPAPPYRSEGPHALWHVSEDASIREFRPHRAATQVEPEAYVWAIDTRHLPLMWFPRECPRGTFWATTGTSQEDVERFLGVPDRRVHAVESGWLGRMRDARVLAYRLPEESFVPHEVGGYWVSEQTVEPVELVELGDLLALHADAEIELRVTPNLWPLWDAVVASSLEFSGIRLHNALPRPS